MDTLVIFWEHFFALDIYIFFFWSIYHDTFYMRIKKSDFVCRLGLAYAGSNREDVLALILPVLGESKANMEVVIIYTCIYNDQEIYLYEVDMK